MSRNMSSLAITPADILRFARDRADIGVVLVTLVGIAGSSPRAIGAQMAVASDGSSLGSFSGGCIEAAIVGEALAVLAAGKGRLVRFGAGSPYIDIRLPCGGGIDLLFTPSPDPQALTELLRRLDARTLATMRIAGDRIAAIDPDMAAAGWSDDAFSVPYIPRVRILAMGHGDALVATARLAQYYGAETHAFSPLPEDVTALSAQGIAATRLESLAQPPALASDPWTAFAFLFHDHEWEEMLLPGALRTPHLFVGAIGGLHSRAQRRDMLRRAGFGDAIVQRFGDPVGLIPATRDPATLALSIVAEIIARYQDARGQADGGEARAKLTEALDPWN
jgi:xanthine dehydrogenase accessory factor